MNTFLRMYDEYLSKQRKISKTDSEITSTESISSNIDENVMKMLKSSYEIFRYSLDKQRNFSEKDSDKFIMLSKTMHDMLQEETLKKNKKKLTDIEFNNSIALALAAYNFGIVHMKIIKLNTRILENVEKMYAWATGFFTSCQDLLIEEKLNRKVILLYMRALHEILSIRMEKQSYEDCYQPLLEALYTYVDYTQNNKYPKPVDVATILDIDDREYKTIDTKMSLDDLHIENLKRLYRVYDKNEMDKHEYVAHMHGLLNTLIKEVFINKNYIEWAMGATELSRFFIQHESFTEARHYLAAASYMMKKNETEYFATIMEKISKSDNQNSIEEPFNIDYDRHQYQCAYIAHLWGQYGLRLVIASKRNLLQNQSCESNNLEYSDSTISNEEYDKESQKVLVFTSLENELKDIIEISDKYLLNLRDFKIVIQKTLEWFNTAIEYFVKKVPKIYGIIILRMSVTYKYFAEFERHKDKRLKIYENQLVLLRNAIEEITNFSVPINITRLLFLELGTSYATVLCEKIDDDITMYMEMPNRETLLEMKNYMQKSLNCFTSYSS